LRPSLPHSYLNPAQALQISITHNSVQGDFNIGNTAPTPVATGVEVTQRPQPISQQETRQQLTGQQTEQQQTCPPNKVMGKRQAGLAMQPPTSKGSKKPTAAAAAAPAGGASKTPKAPAAAAAPAPDSSDEEGAHKPRAKQQSKAKTKALPKAQAQPKAPTTPKPTATPKAPPVEPESWYFIKRNKCNKTPVPLDVGLEVIALWCADPKPCPPGCKSLKNKPFEATITKVNTPFVSLLYSDNTTEDNVKFTSLKVKCTKSQHSKPSCNPPLAATHSTPQASAASTSTAPIAAPPAPAASSAAVPAASAQAPKAGRSKRKRVSKSEDSLSESSCSHSESSYSVIDASSGDSLSASDSLSLSF
jgi:hypothetical protein